LNRLQNTDLAFVATVYPDNFGARFIMLVSSQQSVSAISINIGMYICTKEIRDKEGSQGNFIAD
jgi:hypothetical protein